MDAEEEWCIKVCQKLDKIDEEDLKSLTVRKDDVCLPNNAIFLVGGVVDGMQRCNYSSVIDFSETPPKVVDGPELTHERVNHASVALPNGDVALIGGHLGHDMLETCEIVNAEDSSRSGVVRMLGERAYAAAVLLESGLVLIIGGADEGELLDSCEIFNPSDNRFTACKATLKGGRFRHTASLLPDGKVIVIGGLDWGFNDLNTTEIYDPVSDTFSDGPLMTTVRSGHTATTLSNGKILVAGGSKQTHLDVFKTTELYDPLSNSFSPAADMAIARERHFAFIMSDDKVFIGGGIGHLAVSQSEIYDPDSNSFTRGPAMPRLNAGVTAVPIKYYS